MWLAHAQTQSPSVCISPKTLWSTASDILRAIAEVDSGDGAVRLRIVRGYAFEPGEFSVMDRGKIEVIAGVNLPMLIKLASLRQTV